MASAVLLPYTTLLLLTTAFFARNTQAIMAKKFVERHTTVEAQLGDLPWLALLDVPDSGFPYCTGTIVSPTSVLSAALCLNVDKMPVKGVAYAGNVKYTKPTDFDPPTQKRSIVKYHFYDEKNPFVYNLMLVKINPEWIWTRTVQPIGIVDHERLPTYFTPYCNVSGLGYGSNTEEDNKVARTADMWMGNWRVCMNHPEEHRMCTYDRDMRAPCQGDLGGSVLCDTEPKDKLYGIISEFGHSGLEETPDRCKFPSHDSGFQFVGFYAHWINTTAGDLPNAEEVKAIRKQHENDKLPATYEVPPVIAKRRRKREEAPAAGATTAVPPTTTSVGAELSRVANWVLLFIMLQATIVVSGGTLK